MKKQLTLLLLLASFLFVAPVQSSVVQNSSSKEQKKEQTVYITKTGAKYHRGSCSYLRKSKIAISKKEAIANGYGACSRCQP